MTRKHFLASLVGLAAMPLVSCLAAEQPGPRGRQEIPKVRKSKAEWRKLLPPASYVVLFEGNTEHPGSSPLNNEKRSGTYICAACFLPLFTSETKFESDTLAQLLATDCRTGRHEADLAAHGVPLHPLRGAPRGHLR